MDKYNLILSIFLEISHINVQNRKSGIIDIHKIKVVFQVVLITSYLVCIIKVVPIGINIFGTYSKAAADYKLGRILYNIDIY